MCRTGLFDIRYEYNKKDSVLLSEIISFLQAEGRTRSTEYHKIMFDDSDCSGSVIATEYPLWYDKNAEVGNLPNYPVVTEQSNKMYAEYVAEAQKYGNIVICGELAEFKYYNIDVCIEHAIQKFEEIKLINVNE